MFKEFISFPTGLNGLFFIKGLKLICFLGNSGLQLQFHIAFEDHFGRSYEEYFMKCAYLS